jgi:hypothetical protein
MFAQLTFGSAMIMLGPVRDSAFDKLLKQPDEIGGAETQVCYFFVADAHTHCARAKAAGAEVVFDIAHQANGGRSYSCRDPEGHIWNFGTYDPWQRQAASARSRRGARVAVLVVGLLAAVGVGLFATGHVPDFGEVGGTASFSDIQTASISTTREAPSAETSQRPDNPPDRAEDRETSEIKQAAIAKALQDQFANDLRQQLAQALKERDAAEQAAQATRDQLMKAWIGKVVAEKAAREAQRQLAQERTTAKPQSASSAQSKAATSQ